MGTTPTYALPYPELTDVANVPADMRELADATDTAITSAAGAYKTPPYAIAFRTAVYTTQSNVPVIMSLNEVREGNPAWSLSGGGLLVPAGCGGLYLAHGFCTWIYSAGIGTRGVWIQKNGTHLTRRYNTGAGSVGTVQASQFVMLSPGDIVTVYVTQISGAALDFDVTQSSCGLELARIPA